MASPAKLPTAMPAIAPLPKVLGGLRADSVRLNLRVKTSSVINVKPSAVALVAGT